MNFFYPIHVRIIDILPYVVNVSYSPFLLICLVKLLQTLHRRLIKNKKKIKNNIKSTIILSHTLHIALWPQDKITMHDHPWGSPPPFSPNVTIPLQYPTMKPFLNDLYWYITEACSEPCQTSKMERIEKTVNSKWPNIL